MISKRYTVRCNADQRYCLESLLLYEESLFHVATKTEKNIANVQHMERIDEQHDCYISKIFIKNGIQFQVTDQGQFQVDICIFYSVSILYQIPFCCLNDLSLCFVYFPAVSCDSLFLNINFYPRNIYLFPSNVYLFHCSFRFF